MSLANVSARGAGATLLGQFGRFILQVVSTMILARILDEGDFGVFAMVMALAGLATLLSDFGLSMAAMRAHGATQGQRSNLFWANALFGLVSTVAVYLCADLIAAAYDDPRLAAVAKVIAIVFVLQSLAAQFRAESARNLHFRSLAVCDVAAQAVGLAVAVVVAMLGGAYWALVAQSIAVAAAQLLVLAVTAGWWPGLPRRGEQMRALFVFGANSGGVQLLNYASANVDTFVLGRFWGSAVVGVYNQAFQIFKMPLAQLAAPLTRVAVPILSQLDSRDFGRYVARAQSALVCVLGGAFLGAAAVSEPLFAILLGPGWEQAPSIFVILAFGGIFQALGYVYYWIFLAKDLTGVQLKFAVISRTVMVILIIAGCLFGAHGVAIASSIGLAFNWLLLSIFAVPRAGVDVRELVTLGMRPLGVYLVAFALAYPTGFLVGPVVGTFGALAIQAGVFLAACAGACMLMPAFRRDLEQVIDTMKRMRSRA